MSNVARFALALLLIVVAFTEWLLARARRGLTIEDKARLTDATFWPWWWLAACVVTVFVLSVLSAAIQWILLVRSGVAHGYVRTQLCVFVALYVGMLLFFSA